jgi:hypothetical protein
MVWIDFQNAVETGFSFTGLVGSSGQPKPGFVRLWFGTHYLGQNPRSLSFISGAHRVNSLV